MNNSNKIKYWEINEENKLVDEINNLVEIDQIIKNHDRKITGIMMRIEKILTDPKFSDKIKNKNEVVIKYLKNSKPKYYIDYNELYENILEFKTLDEISNRYNKISTGKIKTILTNILKSKENIDMSKKLRIKCLLNSDEDIDVIGDILKNNLDKSTSDISNIKNNKLSIKNNSDENNDHKINNDLTNSTNSNNESNLISIVISLLNEIKTLKIDIFDIKNRVKIIMDKVDRIEKNNFNNSNDHKNVKSKPLKKNYISESEISNFNKDSDDQLDFMDEKNTDNNTSNIYNLSNTKKIQIENINESINTSIDKNIEIIKSEQYDNPDKSHKLNKKEKKHKTIKSNKSNNNLSDYNDNELEKEFEKYLK